MLAKAVMRHIVKMVYEFIPVLNIVPLYTAVALYDLWELRKERQTFQPIEVEIEALKEQVDNGDQIARQARKRAGKQKANAKKKAQEADKKRKKRQQTPQNSQPRSAA